MGQCVQAGRRAVGIDIDLGGEKMDMASSLGFSNALYQVCNIKEGGAALVAPVCGSFVFMLPDPMDPNGNKTIYDIYIYI